MHPLIKACILAAHADYLLTHRHHTLSPLTILILQRARARYEIWIDELVFGH